MSDYRLYQFYAGFCGNLRSRKHRLYFGRAFDTGIESWFLEELEGTEIYLLLMPTDSIMYYYWLLLIIHGDTPVFFDPLQVDQGGFLL